MQWINQLSYALQFRISHIGCNVKHYDKNEEENKPKQQNWNFVSTDFNHVEFMFVLFVRRCIWFYINTNKPSQSQWLSLIWFLHRVYIQDISAHSVWVAWRIRKRISKYGIISKKSEECINSIWITISLKAIWTTKDLMALWCGFPYFSPLRSPYNN